MEHNNILFEKKFPRPTMETEDLTCEESNEVTAAPSEQGLSDRYKRTLEGKVNVLMPERVQEQGFFIDEARCIAELYEVDTVVTEYENRLAASFRIDFEGMYSGMKNIIRLADDIGFQFDDEGIVFNAIYYTHATYLSGRRISPAQGPVFLP